MARARTNGGEVAILSGAAGFFLLLNRWGQTTPAEWRDWTVDAALLTLLGGGAVFAACFLAAHFGLRKAGRASGWLYGAAGAAAAIAAFLCFGGLRSLELAGSQGLLTIAIGLPLLIGWALGAIYRRVAGIEEAERAASPDEIEAAAAAPDAVLIEAAGQRHYSGPLQIRTSGALLAASGAAVGAILGALVLTATIAGALATGDGMTFGLELGRGAGVSILAILFFALFLFVPVWLSHLVAQKFRIVSAGGYPAVGFATSIAAGFLFPPFLIAAPFTAGAMALYRRWAGLEPVPLPGAVHVRDERALVGSDHAARRYRRIVTN